MAEAPEILTAVVEPPLGAAKDVARGKFEEDGFDVAVLVFGGLVGETLEEPMGAVGEEKVFVVDVVERIHGAAGKQELGGEVLEADWFQRDTKRGVGIAGGQKRSGEGDKKREEADGSPGPELCGNGSGNRHS